MPNRERQLSLLDLKPPDGVPERARIDWHLHYRDKQERIVAAFVRDYGEIPVFWKRLDPEDADLFLTRPENSVLIDRSTGRLRPDGERLPLAWRTDPSNCLCERRRHIPPQVVDLLDGRLPVEAWHPEVIQRLRFLEKRLTELLTSLRELGLGWCLEKERHLGIIRVFGPAEKLRRLFKEGIERGILDY